MIEEHDAGTPSQDTAQQAPGGATTSARVREAGPCAEPGTAQTIHIDAGDGCRVTISLNVVVDGSCGGPDGRGLTPPPGEGVGGDGPDPEMPQPLRRDAGSDHAFPLWTRGSAMELTQFGLQHGFAGPEGPLSVFMTARSDPNKFAYRGFGVTNLRDKLEATIALTPKLDATQQVKPAAWGSAISDVKFNNVGGGKLECVVDIASASGAPDTKKRAVVAIPKTVGATYTWQTYAAQGGFSALASGHGQHVIKLDRPPTGTALYIFVVLADEPLDDKYTYPTVDSAVTRIG